MVGRAPEARTTSTSTARGSSSVCRAPARACCSNLLGLDPMARPCCSGRRPTRSRRPRSRRRPTDPRIAQHGQGARRAVEAQPAAAGHAPLRCHPGPGVRQPLHVRRAYPGPRDPGPRAPLCALAGAGRHGAGLRPAPRSRSGRCSRAQPTGRWVLKTPNHLWDLDALLGAYPDARIIWTHRDPGPVVTSLASLANAGQRPLTSRTDPRPTAEEWKRKCAFAIGSAIAFDERSGPGWCRHLHYDDLMADPVEAVRGLYAPLRRGGQRPARPPHAGVPASSAHRTPSAATATTRPTSAGPTPGWPRSSPAMPRATAYVPPTGRARARVGPVPHRSDGDAPYLAGGVT